MVEVIQNRNHSYLIFLINVTGNSNAIKLLLRRTLQL